MKVLNKSNTSTLAIHFSKAAQAAKRSCALALVCAFVFGPAKADDLSTNAPASTGPKVVPLMSPGQPTLGWSMNATSGGATGTLTMNPDKHDGHDSLLYSGDFSSGTNYLEAFYAVPDLDVSSITMYLNVKNLTFIRLRIEDSTEQWHQFKVSVDPGSGWKKWTFSLDDFFGGKRDASFDPEYNSWNGANDQKWHGPMKSFNILLEPEDGGDSKQESLGISDATVTLKSTASP